MRRCSRPPRCPTHQVDRPDGPHRGRPLVEGRPAEYPAQHARPTTAALTISTAAGTDTPRSSRRLPTDVGQDCRVGTHPHFVAPAASAQIRAVQPNTATAFGCSANSAGLTSTNMKLPSPSAAGHGFVVPGGTYTGHLINRLTLP